MLTALPLPLVALILSIAPFLAIVAAFLAALDDAGILPFPTVDAAAPAGVAVSVAPAAVALPRLTRWPASPAPRPAIGAIGVHPEAWIVAPLFTRGRAWYRRRMAAPVHAVTAAIVDTGADYAPGSAFPTWIDALAYAVAAEAAGRAESRHPYAVSATCGAVSTPWYRGAASLAAAAG